MHRLLMVDILISSYVILFLRNAYGFCNLTHFADGLHKHFPPKFYWWEQSCRGCTATDYIFEDPFNCFQAKGMSAVLLVMYILQYMKSLIFFCLIFLFSFSSFGFQRMLQNLIRHQHLKEVWNREPFLPGKQMELCLIRYGEFDLERKKVWRICLSLIWWTNTILLIPKETMQTLCLYLPSHIKT